jgi:signal-transduction protein with cAMP-binding, CBS, and nucleotidyltransferase domain
MDQKRIVACSSVRMTRDNTGISAERDLLLKVLLKKVGLAEAVGEFVTVPLTTASVEIEGVDAAKTMATKHVKHLPLEDRHENRRNRHGQRDVVEAFARSCWSQVGARWLCFIQVACRGGYQD